MTSQSRTVRVFLSSTFRDFAEERDLLVRKVFPELRRKCRERQVELVDVDLRWGITEKEAQQGKVLPICLAEIDRSRPYFMGFIGERYGWVPKAHEYNELLTSEQTWLDEHRGGKSVTELEMLHGVLNNPAMEDRAFFYFRDPDYSNSKGEAYLSESPEDKAKLEALKDRIRKSGFPVVENYTNPEALAEHVKEDLWNLIDDAFPESKIPDALDLERRRHEIYSASRQGMYIGGETYFGVLDQAMAAQVRKPVLVTGASGGGKSALLANWSRSYSSQHPKAIVLEHYLATGADSAEAIGMVTRLLKEISRIIGEDLVLEGDPRKALHLFPEWLGKAGTFAQQEGGKFLLVMDGLDKMTGGGGLDWWPRQLPDGVGLVGSCLRGPVFDAIAHRMAFDQVVVSPLGRDDCQAFINCYLGKFRKPLPPELVELVLQHPLCGNPLFLRTLLEEMRVFGVHEQLRQKLAHYLASETVDDLFERVLERIEADNRTEDVRAVLEVLWAAKESFAENELLEITGLPPAVWAPIHIALDDSIIGEGSRLLFGHDYLRKAVEDRYLTSEKDRGRIRHRMAEFCAQSMAGGRKDISHYVRCHAVEHFLEAEDWDSATAALSDLEFIEARAIAQELPAMLVDCAEAVKLLPEGEKERQTQAARQAELDRYAREMVEYAATWSRIRYGSGEAEPVLPRPVESVRLWTSKEIAAERKRVTETPDRLDIIKAFRVFVATNADPLQKFSTKEGFAANLARNDAPAGPVHEEGERKLKQFHGIKLIKRFSSEDRYNPMPACIAVLVGHEGGVLSVDINLDGKIIVSGSYDETVRIWDGESGECLRVLKGHEISVNSVGVSGDGKRIVSGGRDKTIRMWDGETGECLKVIIGAEILDNSLFLSGDGRRIVALSNDKNLRIWDAESGDCLKVLEGLADLALSADGKRIVTAGNENTVRILNAESGECLKVLKGHEDDVFSVAVSADGRRIASSSKDNTVRIWDGESGQCLKVLSGLVCGALSADGRKIILKSNDNSIWVWDGESGECLRDLIGSEILVDSLSWSGDGRRIVSGSYRMIYGIEDKTVRIWDAEKGGGLKVLEGHEDGVIPEDTRIEEGRMGEISCGLALAVSGDGKKIGSVSSINNVRIWDGESGECLKVLNGHERWVNSLTVSEDGKRIVSGSEDETVRIWDGDTGECLKVLEGHADSVYSVALSPDGRWIVSGSGDTTLRIWDEESGNCLKVLEGHEISVNSVAVSGDGKKIVSGGLDKTIRIWDGESGECLKVLDLLPDRLKSVVVNWNGEMIVSLSDDYIVELWDGDSDDHLKVLGGHKMDVNSVAVSADGSLIVSGSSDNTLRIWSSESGECLAVYFLRGLHLIGTTPDCQKLAAGLRDGRLEIYDCENL